MTKPIQMRKSYNYNDYKDYTLDSNTQQAAQASYHNYFFSGNDVIIGLVPFYSKDKIIPIPVTDMVFGISQEKVPIYSAFSYTWDAVAKGTRIVRGEFSIVFSQPNHIGKLLGNPEKPDTPEILESTSNPVVEVGGEDLVNDRNLLMDRFWGTSNGKTIDENHASNIMIDPTLVGYEKVTNAFPFGRETPPGKFEADYSGHPPFDLIIMMGERANSRRKSNDSFNGFSDWSRNVVEENKFNGGFNDRFDEKSEKIILKNIELMSCGVGLDPSGQPLRESYSFIARDALIGV